MTGAVTCIFFVRMRLFLLTLDTIDVLCLVYSIVHEKTFCKFANISLQTFAIIIFLCRNLNKVSIKCQTCRKSRKKTTHSVKKSAFSITLVMNGSDCHPIEVIRGTVLFYFYFFHCLWRWVMVVVLLVN